MPQELRPASIRLATVAYGATIFLSAFLLFQIQLIVGKYFLPWFGGTPAMWTTSMFFFQLTLLAGYTYAHLLADKVPPTWQGTIHISVSLVALAWLLALAAVWHSPLLPNARWKPSGPDHPVLRLLVLLAVSTGLPYLVLSTTSPILQTWFARTIPCRTPYRLYALSNLGSFAGLLSYPFAIEPWLSVRLQATFWTVGFFIFVCQCAYCALRDEYSAKNSRGASTDRDQLPSESPGISTVLFWLALATCGSLLFLATTNQICQNIAVVPLLWVLPLSLYLFTLAVCFDRSNWHLRSVFHPAFCCSLVVAMFLLSGGAIARLPVQIILYSAVLFAGCMVTHGELASSKPAAQHLTLFYLMVAAGGAIGGAFVVLVAPHVFHSFSEYPLALWLTTLLMFWAVLRDQKSWLYHKFGIPTVALVVASLPASVVLVMGGRVGWSYVFFLGLVVAGVLSLTGKTETGFSKTRWKAGVGFASFALFLLAAMFILSSRMQIQSPILATRNFYGVLTIQEMNRDEWAALRLAHGRILHGFQFRDPRKSSLPTSYYGAGSGVGKVLSAMKGNSSQQNNLRIGVIGLGVGTLAAYAQAGDYVRFYEINPDVVRLATDPQYFTYLRNCPAKSTIMIGDARLSMEAELRRNQSQGFDVLVVDAFSGDAPPVHLLTREALEVYLKELKPGGILAVNVTNTFINLQPVVATLAQNLHLDYSLFHSDGDGRISFYSDWVLLSEEPISDRLGSVVAGKKPQPSGRVWTDDYSNLFAILR